MHEYGNNIQKLWDKICEGVIHMELYCTMDAIRPLLGSNQIFEK